MWGTDYPLILHNESLEQIDQLDLKPEALQALLHDTAAKVFKINVDGADGRRRRRRLTTRRIVAVTEGGSPGDRSSSTSSTGSRPVTLNRPEKLNALDVETYRELTAPGGRAGRRART